MTSVYFPEAHTPAEWRQMSKDCYRREQESWERSDTDGFLSQWASAASGRLYRFLAEVAEKNGLWEFTVLADAEGNEIEGAREYETRWGWSWRLPNGQWFNPSKASTPEKREAANLKKGFRFIRVTKPAVVMLSGGMMPSPYCVIRTSKMTDSSV